MNKSENLNFLNPSEALNQFTPPDFDTDVKVESVSIVRYGINIGGVFLLIPQFGGSEVLLKPPLYTIPNTPAYFLGVCNIRGNIAPVYDLVKAFNLVRKDRDRPQDSTSSVVDRRTESRQKRILVIGNGEQMVGIEIYSLPQTIQISDHTNRISEQQPLPDRLVGFVQGGYVVEDRQWHELDFMQLIKSLSSNN